MQLTVGWLQLGRTYFILARAKQFCVLTITESRAIIWRQ